MHLVSAVLVATTYHGIDSFNDLHLLGMGVDHVLVLIFERRSQNLLRSLLLLLLPICYQS
jgi:hypothetical protein